MRPYKRALLLHSPENRKSMKKENPLQNIRFFLMSEEGLLVVQFICALMALIIVVGCIVLLLVNSH